MNFLQKTLNFIGLGAKRSMPVEQRDFFSTKDSIESIKEKFARVLGVDILEGVHVNERTALGLSALLACLELRADSYAMAPIKVLKWTDKGAIPNENHPMHYLLNVRPNRYMSPSTFKKTMSVHRDFFGVGVAVIKKNAYAQPIELKILKPSEYAIYEVFDQNGDEVYIVIDNKGRRYEEEDLIMWKGVSMDGIYCRGIAECVKPTIRTGLTIRQFINNYYKNNTFVGGILSFDGAIKKEEAENYKKNWQDAHEGIDKAGKVAVLGGGMKFQPITATIQQSQLVEFLNQDKMDIYQAFRVPPHLVSDTTKSTSFGNGVEHLSIQYVTYTLLPGAIQLEEEINYKCFRTSEQKRLYTKFNFSAFTRGDYQTRMDAYAKLRQAGLINGDTFAELEDMPKFEGGDKYLVNGNMSDLNSPMINEQENAKGSTDNPA